MANRADHLGSKEADHANLARVLRKSWHKVESLNRIGAEAVACALAL